MSPPINSLSMSAPPVNNKKVKKTSQSTPDSSLPQDLLLSCVARVPRSYYRAFSLVSKNFQSLLVSPELYKTRCLLGRTESSLYVCLKLDHHSNPRWFTLYRKPHIQRTKKKNSTGHLLVPIPSPSFPTPKLSSIVAIGSNIYEIGGLMEDKRSSKVSILDCRYHTWHEGPSMALARNSAAANVLDGKIYVAGGCEEGNSSNWMEVFDPKTQAWESLSSSVAEMCGNMIIQSKQINGKIYMYGRKGTISYDPKEGTCEAVVWMPWFASCYCVIDNVMYFYDYGEFKWFDSKLKIWRSLKGLENLPRFVRSIVKLVDFGGNLMVLWDRYAPGSGYEEKVIWCAEIVIERCNSEEVSGKVAWFDTVLTVPKSYQFVHVLATTV